MKRRSAIKNLLIIAGGIAILPSCSQESGKASIQLNNLDINQNQENLLAEITESIIPKTDSPGAKALNLHLFVLKMVDDCHNKDDQKSFINGLGELDQLSKKQFSKSFKEASQAQRTQLLQLLESGKETKDEMQRFYAITKRRTIQGFLNSKYVMKDLKRYELIPGRYDGYASANEITKSAS